MTAVPSAVSDILSKGPSDKFGGNDENWPDRPPHSDRMRRGLFSGPLHFPVLPDGECQLAHLGRVQPHVCRIHVVDAQRFRIEPGTSSADKAASHSAAAFYAA